MPSTRSAAPRARGGRSSNAAAISGCATSRHCPPKARANLAALTRLHLKTARAYQIRLAFQEIYRQPNWDWGALFLDRWYSWAIRSRLEPIKEAARTVMRHRDGILRWFDSQIANGLIEGINSLVQAAKAKARGYRSTRTLKAITYLIAGKARSETTHVK